MLLLHSSALLLLLPLVLAGPGWNDEFSRWCSNKKNFEQPFRYGDVFKKCVFSPKNGGQIKIVGCREPTQGRFVPIGETAVVDKKTGKAIWADVGEELTDICELKDRRYQWRRGSRKTKELLTFLKSRPVCAKHGFHKNFTVYKGSMYYKQCTYDEEKGFIIETIACKSVNGGEPLAIGEERWHNEEEYFEKCAEVNGRLQYVHRKMNGMEKAVKDSRLLTCRAYANEFKRIGSYRQCESDGKGFVSLKVLGCISQEKDGEIIPLKGRFESGEGVIEICDEEYNPKGELTGSVLRTEGKEPTPPPPEEPEDERDEEEEPFSPKQSKQMCEKYGLYINFTFDDEAAWRCVLKPYKRKNVGLVGKIELVGCWNAGNIIAVGTLDNEWRCVKMHGRAEMVIEPYPRNTTPEPVDKKEEIRKKCEAEGINVVFFEKNVAKKCLPVEGTDDEFMIETVGCRFALSDTVVALGEVYESWGVTFRCVLKEDEKVVELVVEEDTTSSPPTTSKVPNTFMGQDLDVFIKCMQKGTKVFFVKNAAKKCEFTRNLTWVIKTIGCRYASTDEVVLLGETKENMDITLRCVATDGDGVDLVPAEPSASSSATIEPPTTPSSKVMMKCMLKGYENVFFEQNVAKKCVMSQNGKFRPTIITIGCRFALSDEVVLLGETKESWGVTFRCVESENGAVHLAIVEETISSPEVPETEVEKIRKKCEEKGLDKVFFEQNEAQKCVYDPAYQSRLIIITIGCRFALSDEYVFLGESREFGGDTFSCVETDDKGGVHLVVVDKDTISSTTPSSTNVEKICKEKGFDKVFFELNAAKKCSMSEDGAVIITVGCRFALSDEVVLLGDKHESWGETFVCVASEDGGVQLVPEEQVSSSTDPTSSSTPSDKEEDDKNRKICAKKGFEKVWFELNEAKKCVMSTYRTFIITVGCRFAMTDEVVLVGQTHESWGETFICVRNENGGVHLRIQETTSSSTAPVQNPSTPEPSTSSSKDKYRKTLKTCAKQGFDKVFFELNEAKQCDVANDDQYTVFIKTIGCRFALTEDVVLLGETRESWGVTFECVENERGVHLRIVETEKNNGTEIQPPSVGPEIEFPMPHCTFNGQVVSYKSRVIVGHLFEFECRRDRSSNYRQESDEPAPVELHFLGCFDEKATVEERVKSRYRSVSEADCDLSSMDATSIEVIDYIK